MPERIQLRRIKGWRLSGVSPTAVVVSRPSIWGNPYRVGSDVTILRPDGGRQHLLDISAATAVDLYRLWLSHASIGDVPFTPTRLALTSLTGKDLACWCPLTDPRTGGRYPCHADVLLELANPKPIRPDALVNLGCRDGAKPEDDLNVG